MAAYSNTTKLNLTQFSLHSHSGQFLCGKYFSFIYHPDTGKCYYDITVAEHHHLFDGESVKDYADQELSHLIREYLERKHFP